MTPTFASDFAAWVSFQGSRRIVLSDSMLGWSRGAFDDGLRMTRNGRFFVVHSQWVREIDGDTLLGVLRWTD